MEMQNEKTFGRKRYKKIFLLFNPTLFGKSDPAALQHSGSGLYWKFYKEIRYEKEMA